MNEEHEAILRSLAAKPARIPALAERVGLNRRAVSRRLELLVREGLVEMDVRHSGAVGRPGYFVRISEAGRQHLGVSA